VHRKENRLAVANVDVRREGLAVDGDIDAVVVAVERDCGRRGKAHERDGEKA
jgi:hypothetical protein